MRIQWNTGRSYTRHGQRITAEIQPDGHVLFADHDRMIYGITRDVVDWASGETAVQCWVQRQYDRGAYWPSNDAMALTWEV